MICYWLLVLFAVHLRKHILWRIVCSDDWVYKYFPTSHYEIYSVSSFRTWQKLYLILPQLSVISSIPWNAALSRVLLVTVIARSCVLVSHGIVLAATWTKTYDIRENAKSAKIQVPIVTLLLRDGKSEHIPHWHHWWSIIRQALCTICVYAPAKSVSLVLKHIRSEHSLR